MEKNKGIKEEKVHLIVILRSASGKSFDPKNLKELPDIQEYLPPPEAIEETKTILSKMGFEFTAQGKFCITVSLSVNQFKDTFKVELEKKKQNKYMGMKVAENVKENALYFTEYYAPTSLIPVPDQLKDLVEDIVIERPIQFCVSPNPPDPGYYHLKVPDQIADLLLASNCHKRQGDLRRTGKGVRVVMVDSGFYPHPYFDDKGYNIKLDDSLDPNPNQPDTISHGTSICSNLLAVAPDIEFIMVKNGTDELGFSGILHAARTYNPDIITCSNGWRVESPFGQPFSPSIEEKKKTDFWKWQRNIWYVFLEIMSMVDDGIVMIFSTGNDGGLNWFGCHQDSISVGGAYPKRLKRLGISWEASSYASSGISDVLFAYERKVPDICGICGPSELNGNPCMGNLIVMPVEPGCPMDREGAVPHVVQVGTEYSGIAPITYLADGTAPDDGWIVASGTSSAAPMVAGVVALMLEGYNKIDPTSRQSLRLNKSRNLVENIKMTLMNTARDITTGTSASGDTAHLGVDLATGAGLVDAEAACGLRYPLLGAILGTIIIPTDS